MDSAYEYGMALGRSIRGAFKRSLDVAGAGIAIVLLAPVIACTALAVAITDGFPVLFRHRRPGLHAKPFILLKFRTMRPPNPGEAMYLTDADRVTSLGSFLRRTSIDELPELWNVLRGEMSLVGPRPLLMEYLPEYTPEESRRHDMRPGITSWAVVNGRHTLSFRDRLALDTWYVDHWTLKLDFKILAMTIWQVIRRTDTLAVQDTTGTGFPLELLGQAPEHHSKDAGESCSRHT